MEGLLKMEARFLRGVLQTLVNLDFHGITAVSVEDLEGQLIAAVDGLTSDKFVTMIAVCKSILGRAASGDWPVEKLEHVLQQDGTASDYMETFLSVWRVEREKVCLAMLFASLPLRWARVSQIHEAVRKKSVLTNELGYFNWRIDVQSSSRRQRMINEPTAVLEFSVGAAGSTQTVLHCEADRAAVAGVLDSIQAIQQCIANVKGT